MHRGRSFWVRLGFGDSNGAAWKRLQVFFSGGGSGIFLQFGGGEWTAFSFKINLTGDAKTLNHYDVNTS